MIERIRPDGFILRPGRATDRQSLLDLIALQHDATDVPEAAMVFDDAAFGPGGWLIAHDRTRVVACIAPFEHRLRVGTVETPALEIEFVTSHPDVAGRGLVRDLFALLPEAYPDHLAHLMIGIPYFYRRLGYEYAIPVPGERLVGADQPVPMPPGWEMRLCIEADLDRIMAAETETATPADVAFTLTQTRWQWLLRSPNYTTVSVARGGHEAFARIHLWQGDAYVFDIAVSSAPDSRTTAEAIRAVTASARALTTGEISLLVRPSLAQAMGELGEPASMDYAYYARITDPVRMLNRMRPLLSTRLAATDLSVPSETLILSLYGASMEIPIDRDGVGDIQLGPPVHAPVAAGGVGVPPDRFAELVLGPAGFATLQLRYPDVRAAPRAGKIASALFPPQTNDVQTWVYP